MFALYYKKENEITRIHAKTIMKTKSITILPDIITKFHPRGVIHTDNVIVYKFFVQNWFENGKVRRKYNIVDKKRGIQKQE